MHKIINKIKCFLSDHIVHFDYKNRKVTCLRCKKFIREITRFECDLHDIEQTMLKDLPELNFDEIDYEFLDIFKWKK